MKHAVLVVSFMLVSVFALGATDASLDGKYAFQLGMPKNRSWAKTFTCPYDSHDTYVATGSFTTMEVVNGVATFDGKGSWSYTLAEVGQFNATASANTMSVTWSSSCKVESVNTGSIVYGPASTSTGTGKYSVESNGTGTMTGLPAVLTFSLAADSAGVCTTVLLTIAPATGQPIGTGLAVHE